MQCDRGIAKAKEYYSWFKESFVCDESHLPLVAIFNVDVVPSTDIKLGKVASIFQLLYEVRDEEKRVYIASGMFVEVAVVLTVVKLAILCLREEEGGCLRGVQWMDLSSSQAFFKEVFCCLFLVGREGVDFANLGHKGLVEIDLMIVWLRGGNMVCGFFREDLGEVSIFRWERDLGLSLFSGYG